MIAPSWSPLLGRYRPLRALLLVLGGLCTACNIGAPAMSSSGIASTTLTPTPTPTPTLTPVTPVAVNTPPVVVNPPPPAQPEPGPKPQPKPKPAPPAEPPPAGSGAVDREKDGIAYR
jgi:outer membrane biosynthesis protein TonB